MADPADTGNPNVFTTFKGRYMLEANGYVTDNPYVMLSCTNDVQPMGDWVLTSYSGEVFAVLPEECRPSKTVKVPVVAAVESEDKTLILTIEEDGAMSFQNEALSYAEVYLSGVNFNISRNWY